MDPSNLNRNSYGPANHHLDFLQRSNHRPRRGGDFYRPNYTTTTARRPSSPPKLPRAQRYHHEAHHPAPQPTQSSLPKHTKPITHAPAQNETLASLHRREAELSVYITTTRRELGLDAGKFGLKDDVVQSVETITPLNARRSSSERYADRRGFPNRGGVEKRYRGDGMRGGRGGGRGGRKEGERGRHGGRRSLRWERNQRGGERSGERAREERKEEGEVEMRDVEGMVDEEYELDLHGEEEDVEMTWED